MMEKNRQAQEHSPDNYSYNAAGWSTSWLMALSFVNARKQKKHKKLRKKNREHKPAIFFESRTS